MLRKARIVAFMALAGALAGCNAPGMPTLAGGADNTTALVSPTASPGNTPEPGDELSRAKKQFRDRNFGLAQSQFQAIVERRPEDAEAWLGLAASYDQLRRFDLADRAYAQVLKLAGDSVAYRNNRGYSYQLRGDSRRAREEFRRARALDPSNEFVLNNLRALGG